MSGADELGEVRELTHSFAAAELRPHAGQWERAGMLSDAVLAQLAELGFLGMAAPEVHGGMAVARPTWLAALAELAWGEASVALAVALHAQVVRAVSQAGEAVQRDWLPALVDGSALGCATIDPAAAACEAAETEGGWRLRGSLPWVGNARAGGLLLVDSSSDAGSARFLVPLDAAGVRRERAPATLGLRALALGTVVLQDVAVAPPLPAASGEAVELALSVAAVAAGIGRAALEQARDYADQREQFGCKLRVFEGLQYKLADMAIRVAAADALLARAAVSGAPADAAMSKVVAAEAAMWVTTQAVQVFGGYGYMRDYPVEKLMRDARAMSLSGGSDHEQRRRIAALLYRE